MTLLQNFQCLHVIGSTSGWFCIPGRGDNEIESSSSPDLAATRGEVHPPVEHQLLEATQTHKLEYTLDISFGISIKTLSCLHRIITLEKLKTSLLPGQSWPSSANEELAKLEEEIYSGLDLSHHEAASSRAPLEGFSQYVAREIQDNHILAFHYSTAIFFRRAICDGTAQIVPALEGSEPRLQSSPRPSGKWLVLKAIEHLENIDALAGDLAIANTLWPGFIAAAEAVNWTSRRRALTWFGRAKRHGIGNIAKAKDIVQDCWRRVDNSILEDHESYVELGPVDWRKVMQSREMYIMLT